MALAIAGLVGILIALAALLDLGPFADDELATAEFLAYGDQICADAHDEFRDLQQRTPRTPADAEELARALIEVAEEEFAAIDEVEPPGELADEVAAYLKAREQGIGLLEEGLAAAEGGDAGKYESEQAKLAATQLDRFDRAREIGFDECSRPLVRRETLARQSQPPPSGDPSAPPRVNNPPTGE